MVGQYGSSGLLLGGWGKASRSFGVHSELEGRFEPDDASGEILDSQLLFGDGGAELIDFIV